MLRDEDANLLAFVNDWIGRGVAATHNSALITEALANGTAGLTLDAAAAIGAGEIPELVGKLAPEYQDGAEWMLAPGTAAYLQGLPGITVLLRTGGERLRREADAVGLSGASAPPMRRPSGPAPSSCCSATSATWVCAR